MGQASDTAGSNSDSRAIEALWKAYEAIGEWIRFADTKASVLLAAVGLIATIVLQNLASSRDYLAKNPLLFGLMTAGLFAASVSGFCCIRALTPGLGTHRATSLIFFSYITDTFASAQDYRDAAKATFSDSEKAIDDMSKQVYALAHVAKEKYADVKIAAYAFGVTILIAISSIVTILFWGQA